jgi:molybdenum storage protein
MNDSADKRHHVQSLLMRESLVDRGVMKSTELPVVRMLPNAHVVKVGGRSILDAGRNVVYPFVDAITQALANKQLILGVGGGIRTRHVFSIGIDLGTATGVLAQLSAADANGNAHILGTLLAPHGVVAIPPEMFGPPAALPGERRSRRHLQRSAHRTRCGSIRRLSVAFRRIAPMPDVFCSRMFRLQITGSVKDVDGLYDKDPKEHSGATLIREISAAELERRSLPTLPFDRVLLKLLGTARLLKQFQIINGHKPELLAPALNGEHVGTIVHVE